MRGISHYLVRLGTLSIRFNYDAIGGYYRCEAQDDGYDLHPHGWSHKELQETVKVCQEMAKKDSDKGDEMVQFMQDVLDEKVIPLINE